jgi:hypothetical protein
MIAGAELAAWLNDRARQTQSREAARKIAQNWAARPIVSKLRAELDTMPVRNAENVMSAAQRFMERRDEIEALLGELIGAASAEPCFGPPFFTVSSDIHSGLLLFEHPDLSIAIGVTSPDALAAKKSGKRGPTSIGFTGYLTRFQFLKAGGATLSFWEAPRIEGSFRSEESGRCRLVERRMIDDGETFVMDGRFQSFVIEHATSDIVNIQAVVRTGASPLAVQYDSRTLEYAGASSTDEASSRTQMMTTLLRLMERDDAAEVVARQLESPHFYTRWHVMRELLAMDAEIALPKLREMAGGDPHPEVRAAAKQTLDALFGEIEEAA